MKKEPSVGIIIINWNGLKDTLELIDSIKQISYDNYKIYLVDNDSSDGSQEEFNKRYKKNKKVELVLNKRNEGLAGGFNTGLKYSLKDRMDYSFIMNNDMVVKKDFLERLVNELEQNENLAAIGPRIYFYEDKSRIWNTGVRFRLRGFKNIDQYKLNDESFKNKQTVDALDGAYLIKNEVLKNIGLLEDDFFIMHEMTGWCLKAKNYGYSVAVLPSSKIWHKVSRSVADEGKLCAYYGGRNWILLLKRYFKFEKRIFGIILYILLFPLRKIYSITKGRKIYLSVSIKGILKGLLNKK